MLNRHLNSSLKLKLRKSFNPPKDQRGMAVIEMIPILVIFMVLLNFTIGFFGAIHTGILGSIAARNYAFDTFRNRTNLYYFRDTPEAEPDIAFHKQLNRIHRSVSENNSQSQIFTAAVRSIDYLSETEVSGASPTNHNTAIMQLADGKRFSGKAEGVNPIWIRPSYGICINTNCGDN